MIAPDMPHFPHFTQPLGACNFYFILTSFLCRIFQHGFYPSFFQGSRGWRSGKQADKTQNLWVRQREGKAVGKETPSSCLPSSLRLPSFSFLRMERKDLWKAARICPPIWIWYQICPMVGTAHWHSTEGRAIPGKLLLLLYWRGGSWYSQRTSLQRSGFPYRMFFKPNYFFWVMCVHLETFYVGEMSRWCEGPPTWLGVGRWLSGTCDAFEPSGAPS